MIDNIYFNFSPEDWGWSESEWSPSETLYRTSDIITSSIYQDEDGHLQEWHDQLNDKFQIIAFSPCKTNKFIQTQHNQTKFLIYKNG